jgi:hypothetical protein
MADLNFKIDPNDFKRAVKLEVNIDELNYLQSLLNCECVFQVRGILTAETQVSERVVTMLSVFESYRMLDDQISDLVHALNQYNKESKIGVDYKDILILNKNVCKIYNVLVNETTKLRLPEDIEELKEKYNKDLVKKIKQALENDFDVKDISGQNIPIKSSKSKTKGKIKEIKLKDSLGINIFSKNPVIA